MNIRSTEKRAHKNISLVLSVIDCAGAPRVVSASVPVYRHDDDAWRAPANVQVSPKTDAMRCVTMTNVGRVGMPTQAIERASIR